MMVKHVKVLGAGIIGVSSALRILELCGSRVSVTIVADKFTPNTTSDGAAGYWEPYQIGGSPASVRQWGEETYDWILSLANSADAAETRTFLVPGYSIFKNVVDDPDYKTIPLDFRHMSAKELQHYPGFRHGWVWTSVMCEGRYYIPWLMKRFQEYGGKLQEKNISSLNEVAEECDILVNCSGLAARTLCHDTQVVPVRGQVIRVEAPWQKHFLNADDVDAYVLPCSESVVLGGTNDDNCWDTTVNPQTTARILSTCSTLIPALKNARVLREWVGLRPKRLDGVRLDKDFIHLKDKTLKVVHNYGHGGAGVTLHWGCAGQAAQLVSQILDEY